MTAPPKLISWRPLECHPYESAWSIAHKFCRWNTARFAEFWALVSVNTNRCPPLKRCYMRDISWIDRQKFASAFRLGPDGVRGAFAERFASGPKLEACLVSPSQVRICPRCAARGFHTHFHDLLFVARCPIHGDALRTDCPKCSRPISSEVTRAAQKDPYACPCGHVFWPTIRSPAFSAAELSILKGAIDWLDSVTPDITSCIEECTFRGDQRGDEANPVVNAAVRCLAAGDTNPPAFVTQRQSRLEK